MPKPTRRRFLRMLAATPLAALVGCRGATPSIFGYQLGAQALYDQNITSVYVPVFHYRAFQTTPYRGMEVDITQAVVREIGRTTTFKVVSDPSCADTELIGNVVQIDKTIMNRNQQNMVRDGDLVVTVDVVWRNLKDGTILSSPRKTKQLGIVPVLGEPPLIPFDPSIPVAPETTSAQQVIPTRIIAAGRYVPELGETNSSAMKRVQDQVAVQIVSMMEKKW